VTDHALTVVPVRFADACEMVAALHRHHVPPVGHKFSIGVQDEARQLRGAAIIGRPVARHRDDGWTLEVLRVVTDGCPNACSALYGAAWRAAKGMGYRRLGTYIQSGEPGTSLIAAGWHLIAQRPARAGWDAPSRPRLGNDSDGIARQLWEVSA
jgi:hypothetical protein